MEKSDNSFLKTADLNSLIRRYSLPCIISLIVAALYNIVDQLFISNASYLGSYGNAANTVVYPMTVVALAFAVMVGDGACSYVSLCLGSGRTKDAKRTVGNAIVLCIAIGIAITVVYLLLEDVLLSLFGGRVNAQTFAYSREYFFWITVGIPFYVFGQGMNAIIRSDGNPRFAMLATTLGAVVNVIFDPIFIFGLHWGMMGAAVATVMGQVLTAILSIWYMCHMKLIKLDRDSFRLDGRVIKKFIPLGMTSLLTQISLVAAMAAINNMIRIYGAKDAIFGQEQYAQIPMAVAGVGFALLLPLFFGLDGVLYSMPVSDLLTFVISAVVIRKTFQELSELAAKFGPVKAGNTSVD